jgi:hypothetical protein
MSVIKTSFSLRPQIEEQLATRGENRSGVINRDLERLYTLYRRTLPTIPLTVDEACLIVDTLNGTLMDADTARLLWAEIEDACYLDGLDKKWHVDGSALVKRLNELSDTQALALIDAAERFWESVPQKGDIRTEIKKYFYVE